MIRLSDVIKQLENLAPRGLQESYDNSGLITGRPDMEVKGIIICLDSLECIVEEAVNRGCNVIIAHHPIVFSGLKRLTGSTYVEKTIIRAIKNDIAIYAIHTNLDNIRDGVNASIADRLGLKETRVLRPMTNRLKKLVTYSPIDHSDTIKNALFEAGAGEIGNYSECSFSTTGMGSFMPGEEAHPFIGEKGRRQIETEYRIEVVLPEWKQQAVLNALRASHPYEEVAYEIFTIENQYHRIGAGLMGELETAMEPTSFLTLMKERMNTRMIRHTAPGKKLVKKVAVCGGAGSFLLKEAINHGADVFISADFKYHEFFDAEDKIIIADIGHFESEQFTIQMLGDYLRKKFTTFAIRLTEMTTNPVYYL